MMFVASASLAFLSPRASIRECTTHQCLSLSSKLLTSSRLFSFDRAATAPSSSKPKATAPPAKNTPAKAAAAAAKAGPGEGAPFRYPIAWQDPDFYDEKKLEEVRLRLICITQFLRAMLSSGFIATLLRVGGGDSSSAKCAFSSLP